MLASPAAAYLVLLIAAILEAAGDALVRAGLQSPTPILRFAFIAAGALALLAYGTTVNLPAWDFGRLLGIYVTLFFVVAQLINLVAFGIRPAPSTLAGGTLIIAGGLVIAFGR